MTIPNAQDPPDQADLHKHLEFVQAIVARLANNSFLMKGWALTVAAALFGYAAAHLSWEVGALGFLPPAAFWFLDSYYLRQERMFRFLYRDVAAGQVRDFSLDVSPYRAEVSRWKTFKSETLRWFYGFILVVAVAVVTAVAIAAAYKQPAAHQEHHPWPHHSRAP
jgi:hypothetical protein